MSRIYYDVHDDISSPSWVKTSPKSLSVISRTNVSGECDILAARKRYVTCVFAEKRTRYTFVINIHVINSTRESDK